MAPRKAIYTPEEAKRRQLESRKKYNDENTVIVKIRMQHMDKAIYEQYQAWKGEKHFATMIRQCVERCMRLDGWTYDPTLAAEGDQDQPDDE